VNYLFLHQNFPGQYRQLAAHLAARRGDQVHFVTQPNPNTLEHVHKVTYPKDARGPVNCHIYSAELDRAIATGAAAADACRRLRDEGLRPDLIVGHSGWGETLFVKDVFPDVPVLANFEFFYHSRGVDVDFDPEFASLFNEPALLRSRNGISLMAFQSADWGHSATRWQRDLHPPDMRPRISVLHEGVDTTVVRPDPNATFRLPGTDRTLTCNDEVLTYVARNLEPYRGFHAFMRALPHVMKRRKQLQVVVLGGDEVSYSSPPPPGKTYRQLMLEELGDSIDMSRLHFLGQLPYESYLRLLQISSAHVYLTYPFVLSWSFAEALACGCVVIGSSTPPVLEFLHDGGNGLTVDFFDSRQLAERIGEALAQPGKMRRLRAAARATAQEQFDFNKVALPRWLALFDDLVAGRTPGESLE
jgi:glycosyltransferase involved in cell wall biosynthesis